MLRVRPIAVFLLRFTLIYALLMAPWPGLAEGYGRIYIAGAEALFGSTHPLRRVQFVPLAPGETRAQDAWVVDTGIALSTFGGAQWATARSSRYTGYVPTVIVIALVLATPISWSRRLGALLLGTVLVHLFVAAMLGVAIQDWFYGQETRMGLHSFWAGPVRSVSKLSRWMGPYFIGPAVIWMLVAFRPRDWLVVVHEHRPLRSVHRLLRGRRLRPH